MDCINRGRAPETKKEIVLLYQVLVISNLEYCV